MKFYVVIVARRNLSTMREDAVRKETWESTSKIYIDIMQTPGMQVAWSHRKHWYSEDLSGHMDELIEKGKLEAKPLSVMQSQ